MFIEGIGGLQRSRSRDSPGTMRSLMDLQTGQDATSRKRQHDSDISATNARASPSQYPSDKSSPYGYDRDRSRDSYGKDEPPFKRSPASIDPKRGAAEYQEERRRYQGSYRGDEQSSKTGDRRADFGFATRDYASERREPARDSYRNDLDRREISKGFFGSATDRTDTYDSRDMSKPSRDRYSDGKDAFRDVPRREGHGDYYQDRSDSRRDVTDRFSSGQSYGREGDQFSQYRSDSRRDPLSGDDYSKTSAYQGRSQDSRPSIPDSRSLYPDRAENSGYGRVEERQIFEYGNERYGAVRANDGRNQQPQADASRYDVKSYGQGPPRSMDHRTTNTGRYGSFIKS